MQSLAVNGYAAADVLYALRGIRGRREMSFRYDLLSSANTKVRSLLNVAGGSVDHDYLAEIKRTAKFTVRDDGLINFNNQRIQPWARLGMPNGGWAEWPLGVFLLTTPEQKIDSSRVVTRDIDAYDQTQILIDDTVPDRYYVAGNYRYTDAVKELLTNTGFTGYVIPDSTKTTPAPLDWEPGTSKYKIIADLLSAANYDSLWFDGYGFARSAAYVNPADATAGFDYATNQNSVTLNDMVRQQDYFKVPNRLIAYTSNPDTPSLRSVIVNSSASSPTSTVSRGRTITKHVEVENVSNQGSLDDIARKMMLEENSLFETIKFDTAIMPIHENGEIYTFNYTGMVDSGKYRETKWSIPLEAGSRMNHEARKAVQL